MKKILSLVLILLICFLCVFRNVEATTVYSIYSDAFFPAGWDYDGPFIDGLEYLRLQGQEKARWGFPGPTFELRYSAQKSFKKVSMRITRGCDLRTALRELAKQVGVKVIEEQGQRAVFIDDDNKTYEEDVKLYR